MNRARAPLAAKKPCSFTLKSAYNARFMKHPGQGGACLPAELLIAALVLFAAFAQGVIGFGFGLIVMAVLPRLLPVPVGVATTAVFGVFVSGTLLWRYRHHVDWRTSGRFLLGAVFTLPIGVYALRELDPDPIARALGVVITGYVVWELWPWRRRDPSRRIAERWAWPAGLCAGILSGAFAMGGPPVIMYATARGYPPAAFRGVLQGFFFPSTILLVANLGVGGVLTVDIALQAAILVPLIPFGTWLGARYGDRLRPEVFRIVVLLALLVLGLSLIGTGR